MVWRLQPGPSAASLLPPPPWCSKRSGLEPQTSDPEPPRSQSENTNRGFKQNDVFGLNSKGKKTQKTINFQCLSDQSHLQSERQHHVRLGQDVSLVSHVQEGVVHGGAFELLFEVRTSFGHRQTLQVRHEQVDRRTQLLHKKRLHLCRDELRVSPLLQDGHTDTQLKQQHVLMFELHSVRMMYVQSFHIHCLKRSCSWSSLRI